MGKNTYEEVNRVLMGGLLDNRLNNTLISLILKFPTPFTIKNFRPISLCTVIYKIISKVIANRLKCFLPYLISLNQTNFVPGRRIINNIIIVQEIIHSMQKKKGKTGWLAIKVELEKPMIEFDVTFSETLMEMSMPDSFIKPIMNCVSSVSMQVIWNGDLTK